jgi:hypothetical protein
MNFWAGWHWGSIFFSQRSNGKRHLNEKTAVPLQALRFGVLVVVGGLEPPTSAL